MVILIAARFQHGPHFGVFPERLGVVAFHFIKQPRHNAIFADLLGDILFGVIGAHSRAVIDVLLKNITDDVGIDVSAARRDAGIEMPVVIIEEIEDAFEGLVFDGDVLVARYIANTST